MEMCLESGYGVINGVGGHTEYLRDGIRPELELEKVVKKGVPLHPVYRLVMCWLWPEAKSWAKPGQAKPGLRCVRGCH